MIQDMADIDDVHLPAQILMCRVDAHDPTIPATPRMKIDAINLLGRHVGLQPGEGNEEPRGPVEQEEMLYAS